MLLGRSGDVSVPLGGYLVLVTNGLRNVGCLVRGLDFLDPCLADCKRDVLGLSTYVVLGW